MIAVTGASGALGQQVLAALLKRVDAETIIAIVRNPESVAAYADKGVIVRQADYDKPDSLVAALDGVDRLLLISSNAVGARVPQHMAVIEAAVKAGIQHLAYTSIARAAETPLILGAEHKPTEAAIRESGLAWTFLRNGWYAENFVPAIAHALETGGHAGASKAGRYSVARRQDYAEAAAVVLTGSGHEGKVYELAGSTSFTGKDLAHYVAAASGKDVAWQDISQADLAAGLKAAGLPDGFADALADSEAHAADGWLQVAGNDLETLTGYAVPDMEHFVADQVKAMQAA